jgi:hypothetical protein
MRRLFALVALLLLAAHLAAGRAHAATLEQPDQIQLANDNSVGITGTQWVAQVFTAGKTGALDRVDLRIFKQDGPVDQLTVQIRTVSSGVPTNTVLAQTTVPSFVSGGLTPIFFSPGTNLVAGTKYAIVLSTASGVINVQDYAWTKSSVNPYAGGNEVVSFDSGTSWVPQVFGEVSYDMTFETYVLVTSDVATQVHNPNHQDVTGQQVSLGTAVHDHATVTTTVNPIPAGSSVDFQLFTGSNCATASGSSENVALVGGSMSASAESTPVILNPGTYGYKAKFNSGDTTSVPSAGYGDCEPFSVSAPSCPASGKINFRWHYSANGSSGSWSATKSTDCATGAISIGPQAMEGDLKVNPGTTLKIGYDFTLPGNSNTYNVVVANPQVTFTVRCVSGAAPSSSTLTVNMPTQAYAVTNQNWYPSGDQKSPLVYQGSIAVPDLCGGGQVRLDKGGTFMATAGVI